MKAHHHRNDHPYANERPCLLSFSHVCTHQDERAFSAEEEEKLQAALQLEAKDLELVLDTTSFILQQVQYQELMKLGVPEVPLLHSCLPFLLFYFTE